MPATPKDHFKYTLDEWGSTPLVMMLDGLPKLKVIYDIGANSGGFSYLMQQKHPEAKIYAFEPVPMNYEYLETVLPKVECIRKGVYYGKTSSRILERGGNSGAYFVEYMDPGQPIIDTGEVMELITLESFDIKPDLIKIDVEGVEDNIIEHSSIVKECPYLIIEWHGVEAIKFFQKFLPNHKVALEITNQFLLCLE